MKKINQRLFFFSFFLCFSFLQSISCETHFEKILFQSELIKELKNEQHENIVTSYLNIETQWKHLLIELNEWEESHDHFPKFTMDMTFTIYSSDYLTILHDEMHQHMLHLYLLMERFGIFQVSIWINLISLQSVLSSKMYEKFETDIWKYFYAIYPKIFHSYRINNRLLSLGVFLNVFEAFDAYLVKLQKKKNENEYQLGLYSLFYKYQNSVKYNEKLLEMYLKNNSERPQDDFHEKKIFQSNNIHEKENQTKISLSRKPDLDDDDDNNNHNKVSTSSIEVKKEIHPLTKDELKDILFNEINIHLERGSFLKYVHGHIFVSSSFRVVHLSSSLLPLSSSFFSYSSSKELDGYGADEEFSILYHPPSIDKQLKAIKDIITKKPLHLVKSTRSHINVLHSIEFMLPKLKAFVIDCNKISYLLEDLYPLYYKNQDDLLIKKNIISLSLQLMKLLNHYMITQLILNSILSYGKHKITNVKIHQLIETQFQRLIRPQYLITYYKINYMQLLQAGLYMTELFFNVLYENNENNEISSSQLTSIFTFFNDPKSTLYMFTRENELNRDDYDKIYFTKHSSLLEGKKKKMMKKEKKNVDDDEFQLLLKGMNDFIMNELKIYIPLSHLRSQAQSLLFDLYIKTFDTK